MPPVRSTPPARPPGTETSDVRKSVPRQRRVLRHSKAGLASDVIVADGDDDLAADHRWQSRPLAARLVQLVVLAVPVGASVACAAILGAALPHAHDIAPALGWWAVVVLASTVTLFAVDRVARRMLPLALLLRLSLLFPDQAPKRFRVAINAWSTRKLRERVEVARMSGETGAPVEAATQVISLLASLAAHDRRTRGHCERVRAYNDLLAEEIGLPDADRDRLRWAALIHDIGKLKVSHRLLNKPGKPTPHEWEVLRAHPARGAEIAAPLAEWLGPWAAAIAEHHEYWDGTGYPHGIAGTDISLGARIVGVADAFEVMTSPRPYSRPVSADAARKELAACAGTQFDPMVVRAFLSISLGRLRKAMGPIAWFTQVPFLAGMPRLSAALLHGGQQAAVGAGGAVGVLAVTAVGPTTPTAHHHPHPADVPTAAVSSLVTHHTSPAAPVSAVQRPTATGAHEPARHATAATTRRPKSAERTSSHRAASDVLAESRHRPGTSTPARGHRDRSTVLPALPADGLLAEHGRCAGNSGRGLGNGGPRDGSLPKAQAENPGRERAPGLNACD